MPDEVFDFRWRVAQRGYGWVRTIPIREPSGAVGSSEQLVLTDGVPVGTKNPAVAYAPLREHTGLFRVFAETPPTKEAVLQFANRFGPLGESVGIILDGGVVGTGEPVSLWKREIAAMREVVELWMTSTAKDGNSWRKSARAGATLSERIRWEAGDKILYRTPGRCAVIASTRVSPELLERFSPPDVVGPAKAHVQKVVNQHLKGRVSPRLLWASAVPRLGLHFVPSNLIGALWLQFARAIDGEKEYRRCQVCPRFIEISLEPTGSRTDRKYCSDACRMKEYRRTKSPRRTKKSARSHRGKQTKVAAKRVR